MLHKYIYIFAVFFYLFLILLLTNISKVCYKTSILIVYAICGNMTFSIFLSQYPVYELRCNKSTNYKDMNEAGLILDFIIKHYNNPLAEKYIFCQGHDKSHHYKEFFWNRVSYITSLDYFKESSFGGLYCIYLHSYKTNSMLKKWAGDVDIYIKRNNILKESISDLNIISPCCATFFVTHDTITKNKLQLYVLLRHELTKYVVNNINRSINSISANRRAGFFMEFYWGKLFSRINYNVTYPPDCIGRMKIIK